MSDAQDVKSSRNLLWMYVYTAIGNLGGGLGSPFVPYYAQELQFTSLEVGTLQAASNFFPNAFQLPFGRLSDAIGKRIPFIFLGSLTASFIYILLILNPTPLVLIILVIVQQVASSAINPAWNALIGDMSTSDTRVKLISYLTLISNVMILLAELVFMALAVKANNVSAFKLPFIIAAVLGMASSFVMLLYKEKNTGKVSPENKQSFGAPFKDRDLRKLLFAYGIYVFFMSLPWALFYRSTVNVVGATNFQIGLISAVSTLAVVLTIRPVQKFIERTGPKWSIAISRIIFVAVPAMYAISRNVNQLIILNAITGLGSTLTSIAFIAYILEIAPPSNRAAYIGAFNLVSGSVSLVGSILGGYLGDVFVYQYGVIVGLAVVYVISTLGRGFSSTFFFYLKDVKTYPETPLGYFLTRYRTFFNRFSFMRRF